MPLPFRGSATFRYHTGGSTTLAEAEEWCARHGLSPATFERGPDGLIRGTCVVDAPEVVHDGAAPQTPG